MSCSTKRKRGFNLIEIAIVLAVIGLVIGGIYVAASAVTSRNRLQQTQKQFVTILQNTKALYASQPYFTYLNHAQLKATGIMPADATDNGTDYLNPYGGIISVGDTSNNGTAGFSVEFSDLPSDACIKIAADMLTAGDRSVRGYQINSTSAAFDGVNVPVGTIANLCNQTKNYFGVYVLLH